MISNLSKNAIISQFAASLQTMKVAAFTLFSGLLLLNSWHVSGLRCWVCSYAQNDPTSTMDCVINAKNVSTPITCSPEKKFCLIQRDDNRESGEVMSLIRTCRENPPPDGEVEGDNVVTHFRSCQTDLCNYGDGKSHAGSAGEDELGAILVKPRSSASLNSISISLLLGMLLLARFFNNS